MIEALRRALERGPYSLRQEERDALLLPALDQLTRHHYERCAPYRRIIDGFSGGIRRSDSVSEVPYLPVSLFKTQTLRSVDPEAVRVTLTSSGTGNGSVSRVFLDTETSAAQQRALANSLMHVLGKQRLPMLVIDTDAVFKNPQLMSARGAGVLGLMRYGRAHAFSLTPDLEPDRAAVAAFLRAVDGKPFFAFGFTFMVWAHFYEPFKDAGFDLSRGTLIHSGGWKTMNERAVGNTEFKAALKRAFGLTRVCNFYGMVEQIGSIFLEGPDDLLHPPNFADVIIRDPVSWNPLPPGKEGVIQLLSLLPESYPGHSVLTADLGVVETVDADAEGWNGKGLRIIGRVPEAELRGCSDVIAVGER